MAALTTKTTEDIDFTKQTRETNPENTGDRDIAGTLRRSGKVASASGMQKVYLEARSQ